MEILILDDHRLYLEGIKVVLAQHFPKAKLITSSETDIESIVSLHPEISLILLDLRMPNGGAPYILTRLHDLKMLIPVLIVSASESSSDVRLVINKGAAGYIPKTSSPAELVHAIKTVLAGDLYLPPQWYSRILESSSHIVLDGKEEITISARLHDVLELLEKGCSTKEISKLLTISENTVYGYVKDLFTKFQVNSRSELIQTAKQLNVFGFD